MSTDNNSITTKFTWFPTQYKNSNGTYLGGLWVNTLGKLVPSGFDTVDFELTNLVKQIKSLLSENPQDPKVITPSIQTESKTDITKYNKTGGAKKRSKSKAGKTKKRKTV
jgi:hypothetical protein